MSVSRRLLLNTTGLTIAGLERDRFFVFIGSNETKLWSQLKDLVEVEYRCSLAIGRRIWNQKVDIPDQEYLRTEIPVGKDQCKKVSTLSYVMNPRRISLGIIPEMLDELVHIFIRQLKAKTESSIYERTLLAV